ncbi:PID-CTERM protein-sorting domain-containing protein [Mariniflexile sp.]
MSFSQVGGGPPPPMAPPPVGLPIDGGVFVALCVGLFYGAKKLFPKSNNS